LVNPWIADFAAYNFWVRPLGLYRLAEWLNARDIECTLVDCLSPFDAPGKFRRVPVEFPGRGYIPIDRSFARYGISREEFRARVRAANTPDCVFITSIMSYWYPGIQYTVEELRKTLPGSVPLILGGIYATLWPSHAEWACGVDLVCKGPLEACAQDLCAFLDISPQPKVPEVPWYRLACLSDTAPYGAVRTASGCPFSCTYCASRIVSGRFAPRPWQEVAEEIMALHAKGINQIAFYDDALLVDFDKRMKPVLLRLQGAGIRMRFHTPNGLHARLFISPKVARYMKEAGFHTLRLSLEMTQPVWQARLGAKATLEEFDRALSCLFEAGFTESAIRVYLLVGLPGQTLDEVEQGIREVQKRGVQPSLAEYSPIPGTALWEEACRASSYPLREEPLTHNNTLLPCGGGGVTKAALDRLRRFMGDQERFSDLSENGPVESEALAHEKPHEKHTG